MIFSRQHRFIFFAVPKTASQAIRLSLGKSLGTHDWQQQALKRTDVSPIPAIAALGHGHISVSQLQPHVNAEEWAQMWKFAFVRHPLDRFVSACAFLFRNDPGFATKPTRTMKIALDRPRFLNRVLIRPQTELLVDQQGDIAMDYVGRYENLDHDFAHVCRTLDLSVASLPTTNASAHASFEEYYDAELRSRVSKIYAEDFERFGYS